MLSGNRPVTAETRRRVQAAIEELGFRPHAGAQSMRRQSSGIIGAWCCRS
jgi:LacI family transcriptional regulator